MTTLTPAQQAALHVYFREVAARLREAGIDMKALLKPHVEIPATEELIKDMVWRPVQKIMTGIESTGDISTTDVNDIYQVVSRHLAEKHGISVAFPDRWNQGAE